MKLLRCQTRLQLPRLGVGIAQNWGAPPDHEPTAEQLSSLHLRASNLKATLIVEHAVLPQHATRMMCKLKLVGLALGPAEGLQRTEMVGPGGYETWESFICNVSRGICRAQSR